MVSEVDRSNPPLGVKDLDNVLRLLETCERATSLAAMQEETLEGVARFLGYRNATFFVGPTLEELFTSGIPVVTGLAKPMVAQYLEAFHQSDPFFRLPTARRLLGGPGVVSLDHLDGPLPPPQRRYLDRFLFPGRVHAKVVIRLANGPSGAAVMGLLDRESGAFDWRDLAVASLLSQHLGNLVRLHLRWPEPPPTQTPPLSPRQADVVRLVAQGLTNQQIADTLFVTVDTVKKHLTHALDLTGCNNRTQLAVLWRLISSTSATNPRPEELTPPPPLGTAEA